MVAPVAAPKAGRCRIEQREHCADAVEAPRRFLSHGRQAAPGARLALSLTLLDQPQEGAAFRKAYLAFIAFDAHEFRSPTDRQLYSAHCAWCLVSATDLCSSGWASGQLPALLEEQPDVEDHPLSA